jgi:hypothetical protein
MNQHAEPLSTCFSVSAKYQLPQQLAAMHAFHMLQIMANRGVSHTLPKRTLPERFLQALMRIVLQMVAQTLLLPTVPQPVPQTL